MLGEFFVAAPADIDDEVVERGPHGRFSTVEANGLSHVPIARLGSLLGAGSYDELMAATDARPSSSGEAVLFQIPRQIRDALADAERVDDVASAWAQTPELSLSGWRVDVAEDVLGRLVELARGARSGDGELWYWLSV